MQPPKLASTWEAQIGHPSHHPVVVSHGQLWSSSGLAPDKNVSKYLRPAPWPCFPGHGQRLASQDFRSRRAPAVIGGNSLAAVARRVKRRTFFLVAGSGTQNGLQGPGRKNNENWEIKVRMAKVSCPKLVRWHAFVQVRLPSLAGVDISTASGGRNTSQPDRG